MNMHQSSMAVSSMASRISARRRRRARRKCERLRRGRMMRWEEIRMWGTKKVAKSGGGSCADEQGQWRRGRPVERGRKGEKRSGGKRREERNRRRDELRHVRLFCGAEGQRRLQQLAYQATRSECEDGGTRGAAASSILISPRRSDEMAAEIAFDMPLRRVLQKGALILSYGRGCRARRDTTLDEPPPNHLPCSPQKAS